MLTTHLQHRLAAKNLIHNCTNLESSAVLLTFLLTSQSVNADAYNDFQLRRLLSPTEQQYLAESTGKVYIYDGMESNQIDLAMDVHFDRIDSMMFTRIVHKNEYGEQYVNNDGCD